MCDSDSPGACKGVYKLLNAHEENAESAKCWKSWEAWEDRSFDLWTNVWSDLCGNEFFFDFKSFRCNSFESLEFWMSYRRNFSKAWCSIVNSWDYHINWGVIGNVWKFLTSPIVVEVEFPQLKLSEKRKWRKINCGFKKSISANHCNKSRFSLSCTTLSLCAGKMRQTSTTKTNFIEIYFRINGCIWVAGTLLGICMKVEHK